jgi:hypothetical protein
MGLRNVAYGVRAAEVRGRTIRREVSHLFAVGAAVSAFIFAPMVVFHLSFREQSGAKKYSTPLLVLRL